MTGPVAKPGLGHLAAAISASVRGSLSVACTAEVRSFDRASATVRVRPLVSTRLDDGTFADAPEVDGVPVAFFRAGGFCITCDCAAGDLGTLLIRDRSHDEVDDGGADYPVQPESTRRFSLTDAVFLPGYVSPADGQPTGDAAANALVLGMPNGAALRIGDATASKALALAAKVNTELGKIATTLGTLTAPAGGGTVTAGTPYTRSDVDSARAFTDDT